MTDESKNSIARTKKLPIERILGPFQHFLHAASSSGIVLLATTIIALVLANSQYADQYHEILEEQWGGKFGEFIILKSLHHWINDGLMAIFFFVVGLEIKREILAGELSQPREAALPIAAALGGMIFPAIIYCAINLPHVLSDPENNHIVMRGWGVPMATDIAFSLGVLALLGRRIPIAAKVFLTAFAIVDDIGASLVIAVFYTDVIVFQALGVGAVIFALMIGANRLGVRAPLPYAILGILLWGAFLKSGVHPTIAGILAALTIPARTRINSNEFLGNCKVYIEEFEKSGMHGANVLTDPRQRAVLQSMEKTCEKAQTPLQRLEYGLHPWVSFAIMPIFALANAGVTFNEGVGPAFFSTVSMGIIFGLILGKTIGVVLFSWIAVRLNIASLPSGVSWRHIFGVSLLGAIGFTMALFIAGLAFKDSTHETMLTSAKIGILVASLIAGIAGYLVLLMTPNANSDQASRTK